MDDVIGNGRTALADALDICTAELEILIDRHFSARRELIVEREGNKWTAAIGDDVLFRSPDGRAVLRFARTFADRTPGVVVYHGGLTDPGMTITVDMDTHRVLWPDQHSVRVDANVVPIR